MVENKKSILAETLEDIQTAKQQVEENANFILTSTLKDELSEILRSGLNESVSDEETETKDIATDEPSVADSPEAETPATDAITSTTDMPGEEIPGDEGDEVIDLTGATPEEVLTSFKLMAPTDEIEIVKSENGISINFSSEENDNKIGDAINAVPGMEMGAGAAPESTPATSPSPADNQESGDEEEELFEIEITEETPAESEKPVDEAMSHHMNMKKRHIAHNGNDPLRVDETEEAESEEVVEESLAESREKIVAARKKIAALTLENRKIKKELEKINENVGVFKNSEEDYKKAISTLKTQLQEVALFTSNLTFAVKLMTENTTTKDEKVKILTRLDGAKTITESRAVFTSLNESFKSAKSTSNNQLLENKILGEEKLSGASRVNESIVYTNPQVERIKEIIGKMK